MKYASRFAVQSGWKVFIADMGLNPAEILRSAQLPGDLFARKGASVSPSEYFALWRALEEAGGVDEVPLALGRAISVEAFDPPIFASFCSPNFNTAVQRLATFKRLIGPMFLTVEAGPDQTSVTIDCYRHEGQIPRSLAAAELVFLTQLARLATRQNIVPLKVQFTDLPERKAPYAEFFGVMIRQGDANQLTIAARDASTPFVSDNHAMWSVFEPVLRQRLSDLNASASMSERVRGVLLDILPSGQASIEIAANRLAISKRTLQRTLSDESVNYQEVLNRTRRELAEHYLVNTHLALAEISFLLGFRDSNSFIRAFRDWTGTTPGTVREDTSTAEQ